MGRRGPGKTLRSGASDSQRAKVPKQPKVRVRKQFNRYDWKLLLDWLQLPGNLIELRGSEGKTRIGLRHPKKMEKLAELAEYVNTHQLIWSTLQPIDAKGAKHRYLYITGRHREVRDMTKLTGFGLTEADTERGITTILQKLDDLCPSFWRLEEIFGDNPILDLDGNLYVSPLSQAVPDSQPHPANAENPIDVDDVLEEEEEEEWMETENDTAEDEAEMNDAEYTETVRPPPARTTRPTSARQSPLPSPRMDVGGAVPAPSVHDPPPTSQAPVIDDSPRSSQVRKRKSFDYPNKKDTVGNRQSMNASFAATLETLTDQKSKVVDMKGSGVGIRRDQLEYAKQLQNEKVERERLDRELERADRKEKNVLQTERLDKRLAQEDKKLLQADRKLIQDREIEQTRLQMQFRKLELKLAAEKETAMQAAKVRILEPMLAAGKSPEEIATILALLG